MFVWKAARKRIISSSSCQAASSFFYETNCKAHLKFYFCWMVLAMLQRQNTYCCPWLKKPKHISFVLLGWLEMREFPFYFFTGKSILGGPNPLYPSIHSIHPYLCFRQRKWSLCLQILYIFLRISMSHNLIDFHIAISIIYSTICPNSIFLAT